MGRALRYLCTLVIALGALGAGIGGALWLGAPGLPAFADGPIACGPLTQPPDPGTGFCADYNAESTWYGTYGPGFPTATGFGLCADPPASGGAFPVPAYTYVAGAAPQGAAGDTNVLGFAFSQGQALGWWGGVPGLFSADQAGAAAKLLYDAVVWGTPLPAMDPGVLAAFDAFNNWYVQAQGTADAPVVISTALSTGATTFTGNAIDNLHVQFAGSAKPVAGLTIVVSITNGAFNSASGPTTLSISTDANGNVALTIFATVSAQALVTVSVATALGVPGLTFSHPSTDYLAAQILASFGAPIPAGVDQVLTSAGVAQILTGTVSVLKSGDDQAYYPVGGAVFSVLSGQVVLSTLTTNAGGITAASTPIPVGTYVVHEVTAPPGYTLGADQSVTVNANANAVVSFTGTATERISAATLLITKHDAQGGAPLAGAVFDVAYSRTANSIFDDDLGTCTTNGEGTCAPNGNDGADLLPGRYAVQETAAPPGYYLDPTTARQVVTLSPGQAGTLDFTDASLGSLNLDKTGDDTAYTSVSGAVFTVAGPSSAAIVGTLTVGPQGSSGTLSGLIPGTYTLTETTPPPGYQAIAPLSVAVTPGHVPTTIDVMDHVVAATLSLLKVDRTTNTPLAGAVLKVVYDSSHLGTFSDDLGTCTTSSTGTCSPGGNDGAALLPGDYRVSEVAAPPGYALDPQAPGAIVLTPGQVGVVTFTDAALVAASFEKSAVGNVNPALVTLGGAVIDVRTGSVNGTTVASCSTNAAGACTTGTNLASGSQYCFVEVVAPAGLANGATRCFVATNAQASTPIDVSDAGLFVEVAAHKVDATNPAVGLGGAVLDLYRNDGGDGPGAIPTAPGDAAMRTGQTWMARASTAADGTANFGFQFPGYAYCVVEHQAPVNYLLTGAPQCTSVLAGTAVTPASLSTLTVSDTEATVTLSAHKFNSAQPDTNIVGAVYDLYVEGDGPPTSQAQSEPSDVATEVGDTWFDRATTDGGGNLRFTVPAGYAWCLREVVAPSDYLADMALHCTDVLTVGAAPSAAMVALPETQATISVTAHKYNALQPDTVIAGATYAIVIVGALPAATTRPPAPTGVTFPAGDTYWDQATTTESGLASFTVPAGHAWCLHELVAPPAYRADPAYHCTDVLTTQTPAEAATIALPEVMVADSTPLAFTGGPSLWFALGGLALIAGGGGLVALRRRHRAQ